MNMSPWVLFWFFSPLCILLSKFVIIHVLKQRKTQKEHDKRNSLWEVVVKRNFVWSSWCVYVHPTNVHTYSIYETCNFAFYLLLLCTQLRIEAYDLGIPTPLSSELDLTILVKNIDDYKPAFMQSEFVTELTGKTIYSPNNFFSRRLYPFTSTSTLFYNFPFLIGKGNERSECRQRETCNKVLL